eukprot:m51a1_g5743 hypothetical protein (233) ;mRNA; f:1165884-1166582
MRSSWTALTHHLFYILLSFAGALVVTASAVGLLTLGDLQLCRTDYNVTEIKVTAVQCCGSWGVCHECLVSTSTLSVRSVHGSARFAERVIGVVGPEGSTGPCWINCDAKNYTVVMRFSNHGPMGAATSSVLLFLAVGCTVGGIYGLWRTNADRASRRKAKQQEKKKLEKHRKQVVAMRAFASGLHARLGADSPLRLIDYSTVRGICLLCTNSDDLAPFPRHAGELQQTTSIV